jgi:hypothetical protein
MHGSCASFSRSFAKMSLPQRKRCCRETNPARLDGWSP